MKKKNVDYQDPVKYVIKDIKVDKKIVDLASIILKIEQSIEPKFLRRPLGNFTKYFDNHNYVKSFFNILFI